jgi:hypothetical protein
MLAVKKNQGSHLVATYNSGSTGFGTNNSDATYDQTITFADLQDEEGSCLNMIYRDMHQSTASMQDLRHAQHDVGEFVAILEPYYKSNNLSPSGDLPIIESKSPIAFIDVAETINTT